ncbi:MAG TPA: hypothetical protein VF338_00345 [Leptolinea sp.]
MNNQFNKAPSVELMPGLIRQEFDSSVRIIYKWYAGLGGFSHKVGEVFIFILGLIPFIYSINGVISFFKGQSNFLQSMMSFFFLFGGLSLLYRGFTLVFNQSVFEGNNTRLTVHHGPLPFSGTTNLDLKMNEIQNVEWRKVGHSNNSSNLNGFSKTGYSSTFEVVVNTNMGKSITILYGIQTREYAFAIASEISKYLHK